MVEILQVDATALRELGKTLTGQADLIAAITLDVAVTMPGSPVHSVSTAIDENAEAAFHAMGDRIGQMARVAGAGAKTYEEVDHAFGEQFRKLA
ncbi:hypothetical protein [Nocardia sp. A7]|uniref:hypothetical protein n=1 Tax=Nocardia sp. A7 TaxID=2789274 RepID=UPI00397924D7